MTKEEARLAKNARAKKRYYENRDRLLAEQKAYNALHKEEILEKKRQLYANDEVFREKRKAYVREKYAREKAQTQEKG